MSPVYNTFDPSKVTANFEVLSKDDYEILIGEPKAFARTGEKGENWGVRYSLTVAEGDMKGKRPQPQTCYIHNEASQGFTKQFLMAALGFGKGRAEEKKYDEDAAGKDWSIDPESGMVGDAWRELVGKRVIIGYDIGMNPQSGEEQQKTTGFRSISV